MVGFYPAFEPPLSSGQGRGHAHRDGVAFEGDGAALFHHAALLDEIALERGVPPLTSFADEREPPPDFDGYPEELHEALGPWRSWFSPTEGLRAVEGLLEALDDPATRARVRAAEAVLSDLAALHAVLLIAKKRRARFRLEIT